MDKIDKMYAEEKVDERSDALIQEFYTHFSECIELDPKMDQRVAFEGWVIQKLASIQVVLESFASED